MRKAIKIVVIGFIGLSIIGAIAESGSKSKNKSPSTQPAPVAPAITNTAPAPAPLPDGSVASIASENATEENEPSGYSGWTKGDLKKSIAIYETSNHATNQEAECWTRTVARSYTPQEAVATKGAFSESVTLELAANCIHTSATGAESQGE